MTSSIDRAKQVNATFNNRQWWEPYTKEFETFQKRKQKGKWNANLKPSQLPITKLQTDFEEDTIFDSEYLIKMMIDEQVLCYLAKPV